MKEKNKDSIKDAKKQLLLDIIAEFNDYDHPLEFDAKYVQKYLSDKLESL